VLHERQLSLSRKKSRIGSIDRGFHYLGVDYLPTRQEDKTTVTHANDDSIAQHDVIHYLFNWGGNTTSNHQSHVPVRIVPHSRTLRKARTQVQLMVITGFFTRRIRRYLHHFLLWWTKTSGTWTYHELIEWFIRSCRDIDPAAFAAGLLQRYLNNSLTAQPDTFWLAA
jgi:RNA-directed DNA polymerase